MKFSKKLSRPATNLTLIKAILFIVLLTLGLALLGYVYLDRRLSASVLTLNTTMNQLQTAQQAVVPTTQPKVDADYYPRTPEDLSCDDLSEVPLAYAFTFIGYEPIGSVTLNGKIIKKTVQDPWGPENATVDKIFYEVASPTTDSQQIFVDRYSRMAEEGNFINVVENQKLLFALGSNKGGTEFSTTADIEQDDWSKILSFANSGKSIKLRLTISTHKVHGVDTDFTGACRIATE